MHFFNPVPLMKLVEIIQGAETSEATMASLEELGRRFGRTPVRVKDSPGFLVNFGGRAFTTEGLRIAHEGVATPGPDRRRHARLRGISAWGRSS